MTALCLFASAAIFMVGFVLGSAVAVSLCRRRHPREFIGTELDDGWNGQSLPRVWEPF